MKSENKAGVQLYTQHTQGRQWIEQVQGRSPLFACILGFTETGLIPGISAAGATPQDRTYTAIADAEFLYYGVQARPLYPLPPLTAGASPVLISRAVITGQQIPLQIFNAGLPIAPPVPHIDLGGQPARCLSHGQAMPREQVDHLLQQGLLWGEKLAEQTASGYVILSECVVGGTTTALAVLTGLGVDAHTKVNSSHPHCNHDQKWAVVQAGLANAGLQGPGTGTGTGTGTEQSGNDPLRVVAALGDPMQVVVAGMAIAASQRVPVLLAGGTQMLAVYALAQAIAHTQSLPWQRDQIAVGTTRWVADDPTGDTVGLANAVGATLLATPLSFANSRFAMLRAYEQGYVKEGVGAGGCAIAAHLYRGWGQTELLNAIETLADAIVHNHRLNSMPPQ